jgi:hypothetical protein
MFLKLMGPNFVYLCLTDLVIAGEAFVSGHKKTNMFPSYNAATQWLENKMLWGNILTYKGGSDRTMGPTA